MDHQLPPNKLVKLDVLLDIEWQSPASPLKVVPLMPGRFAWKWDLLSSSASAAEELESEGHLEFEAPVDLHGTAFRRALSLGSAIRWGKFLTEENIQVILCSATRRIAQLVGGHTVIFLPDSIGSSEAVDLLYDGEEIEDVIKVLSQVYGPPAPSFAVMKWAWEKEQDCYHYFIEATKESR
jgi:hypothetical protein